MPGGRYRDPREGETLQVSGMPVPFTFWPDAYLKFGRLVASNPWACMQGHVNRTVKNNKQRKRALAFLEQSEGFYRAASAPGMAPKPLLYYYSYLNLAKAFLTVCHNLSLEHCMHGLKEPNDNVRKKLTITSQYIKINKVGGSRTQVYRRFVEECGFTVPSKPTPTKLVDLLEQVVGIHRTACHTLNRKQRFFPVNEITFKHNRYRKEVWVALRIKRTDLGSSSDSPKEIRDGMIAFKEVSSSNDTEYRCYESKIIKSYGRSPKDVLKALVKEVKKDIWSLLSPGGYRFFVSSIPTNKRLAQVASNYQSMFYFGSVTRYRPHDFLKLVEGKHGWLVQEFINTQPLQFIYLLGSGLLKTEMVVPEAATSLIGA